MKRGIAISWSQAVTSPFALSERLQASRLSRLGNREGEGISALAVGNG